MFAEVEEVSTRKWRRPETRGGAGSDGRDLEIDWRQTRSLLGASWSRCLFADAVRRSALPSQLTIDFAAPPRTVLLCKLSCQFLRAALVSAQLCTRELCAIGLESIQYGGLCRDVACVQAPRNGSAVRYKADLHA